MYSNAGQSVDIEQMRLARAKLDAYRSFDLEDDLEFCPIASASLNQVTSFDSAFLTRILASVNNQQSNQVASQMQGQLSADDKKLSQNRRNYLFQLQQQQQQQQGRKHTSNPYSQYGDQNQDHLQYQQQQYGMNSSFSPTSSNAVTSATSPVGKRYLQQQQQQQQQQKYPVGQQYPSSSFTQQYGSNDHNQARMTHGRNNAW